MVVFSSILDFQAQVVRGSMIDIEEEMAFLANKARHWFGCRRRRWIWDVGFVGGNWGAEWSKTYPDLGTHISIHIPFYIKAHFVRWFSFSPGGIFLTFSVFFRGLAEILHIRVRLGWDSCFQFGIFRVRKQRNSASLWTCIGCIKTRISSPGRFFMGYCWSSQETTQPNPMATRMATKNLVVETCRWNVSFQQFHNLPRYDVTGEKPLPNRSLHQLYQLRSIV